ncbi:hypothetical protein SAMN05720468_10713 [Fibrobacter sp. UWEL]|nr:hypothetical protein SAMN05720468_10713 [Fibrobacter sp. UWEL]
MMDGTTVSDFFTSEVKAFFEVYRNLEYLLPNSHGKKMSDHAAEEGRFVEELIRNFLKKHLPEGLGVYSGFVVRPAVKANEKKLRAGEKDEHSSQIDIIVYDKTHYPIYENFNEFVVVPPEGVIALISVKRTLTNNNIGGECNALKRIKSLFEGIKIRHPLTAIVGIDADFNYRDLLMKTIEDNYSDVKFEDTINMVSCLKKWTVFKKKPNKGKSQKSEYLLFEHPDSGLGMQHLVNGILSVYYDKSRFSYGEKPGFLNLKSTKTYCLGKLGKKSI